MMMKTERTLSSLLAETVDNALQLDRAHKDWQVEGSQNNVSFRVKGKKSFGFCLDANNIKKSVCTVDPQQDCPEKNAFTCFSSAAPKGVEKMCDGILVYTHDSIDYIFCIELKSKHSEDYRKQINNAVLFCDWMIALLKQHGYYTKQPCFVGILVQQRSKRAKKKIRLELQNHIVNKKTDDKVDWLLKFENIEMISCYNLCEKIIKYKT